MSNIFQSGFSNIGARATAQAKATADKYNQELQKREMVSQTEESLGGVKLFTSGRELGSKIINDSKLKPYLKQQVKKLFKKDAGDDTGDSTGATGTTTGAESSGATGTGAGAGAGADDTIQMGEIGDLDSSITSNAASATEPQLADVSESSAKFQEARATEQNFGRSEAEQYDSWDTPSADAPEPPPSYNQAVGKANATPEDDEANPSPNNQAEPKPEEDEDEDEDADSDLADVADTEKIASGVEDTAEIGGLEAVGSVLDAIPGLDIIGAALGAAGLIAGFTKKPPHAITQAVQSYSGASNQVGV